MPKISEILEVLEREIPLSYQEKWDNSGVQVGDVSKDCTGVLLAVEATEATVQEAKDRGFNLLITHHPLLFHPLSKITTFTYVERTTALAVRYGITLYASHTSCDNVLSAMNGTLAERFSLKNCRPLLPSTDLLYKIELTVPKENAESVKRALFEAGAGKQGNYKRCCYSVEGMGEFVPEINANPYLGIVNQPSKIQEVKLSLLIRKENVTEVISALQSSHPYEEPSYEIIAMKNASGDSGVGLIGELENPWTEERFLEEVRSWADVKQVVHSSLKGNMIRRIGICSGAGGSLLLQAKKAGCEVLLTGEARYNDFLDASGYEKGGILLVTIGHFESETVAREIFLRTISASFPNFAITIATKDVNPLHYFR